MLVIRTKHLNTSYFYTTAIGRIARHPLLSYPCILSRVSQQLTSIVLRIGFCHFDFLDVRHLLQESYDTVQRRLVLGLLKLDVVFFRPGFFEAAVVETQAVQLCIPEETGDHVQEVHFEVFQV